ncbi:hypothetical protein HYH03_006801 [Edaphochlamys debaryana]|uniref:Uncharacterized protein n=1 Tax=Edaphochlamys debaryana TaxID=47281 RepID=A0A835Y395_9CHLO|nr:hypothetical protein HYH03_006801 [Edaphochlamys debaryana]|eukprot:KAG2495195.1 hypothetical protein HYH03_006801 [Edaphochlamys debaryana]
MDGPGLLESPASPSSSRGKAKTVLNRRPSGYWKVFSTWWRSRHQQLSARPTVNEVIEWYNKNASSSWPSGQVPSLKAVLRQSKGLRPIDGLKEYFREYRKKRKQQGGQALTAGDDAAPARRARATKRRRGRCTRDDSSSEDEEAEEMLFENEASSDQDQDYRASEDEDEAEAPLPRRRRTASAEEELAAVPEAAADSGLPCPPGAQGFEPAQAFSGLDSWDTAAALPLSGFLSAPEHPCAAAAFPSSMVPGMEPSFVQLPAELMPAAPMAADSLHPSLAPGMIPVPGSASPALPEPLPSFNGIPSATILQAVPVRRAPPRLALGPAALRRLPPLSCSAASAKPCSVKSELEEQEDRCSTGGGARTASFGTARCSMFDGMPPGPYGYPPYFAHPPPPYMCYPHPHYPYGPYPGPMPYGGPHPDASDAGCACGACGVPHPTAAGPSSGSASPFYAAAWAAPHPMPGPCMCGPCCGGPYCRPPPSDACCGSRPQSPYPAYPHPADAETCSSTMSDPQQHLCSGSAGPFQQRRPPCGGPVSACAMPKTASEPHLLRQLQHQRHMQAMMRHMPHHPYMPHPYAMHHAHPEFYAAAPPPWAECGRGMVTAGSTASLASSGGAASGAEELPSLDIDRSKNWPFAHTAQASGEVPVAPSSPAVVQAVAVEIKAEAMELDCGLVFEDGRDGLDTELATAWESFISVDAGFDAPLVVC